MALGLAAYGPQLANVYSSALGTARGLAELGQYQEQRRLQQQLRSLWQQAGGDLERFKRLGGYQYLSPGQIAALESALASKMKTQASILAQQQKLMAERERENQRLEAMANAAARYEEGDVAGARRAAYLGGVEKNLQALFPERPEEDEQGKVYKVGQSLVKVAPDGNVSVVYKGREQPKWSEKVRAKINLFKIVTGAQESPLMILAQAEQGFSPLAQDPLASLPEDRRRLAYDILEDLAQMLGYEWKPGAQPEKPKQKVFEWDPETMQLKEVSE